MKMMMMMTMMMEGLRKQGKFSFRRVHETGLLGCFMAPRLKRQAPSSLDSASSSLEEDFFSSDDPDVNLLFTTGNSTSEKEAAYKLPTKCAKSHTGSRLSVELAAAPLLIIPDAEATKESFVSSPPAPADAVLESSSSRPLSDPLLSTFSYNCVPVESTSTKARSNLRGSPQPLPPPLFSNSNPNAAKPVWLPLPAAKDWAAPTSSELRFMSGASSFVATSSALTSPDAGGVGTWSIRRGKSAPAGGLPLPPPSVATKLLPGLESYEFEDLLHGTREFAPECCMEKGDFGAVYRAWVQGKGLGQPGRELAAVRLTVNENQTLKDWKSDVQMLVQLRDSNVCLIKGYCAHEDVGVHSVQITSERLLVFEQSPNGNLHDYLCGSRSKTQLDWSARISIMLGAARGLMYLHDRAPLQIVYREFKGSSVFLDKDYTPRLAGYNLAVMSSSGDRKSSLTSVMKKSQAHAKSNVWSFGIVLVELLTGKHSLDTTFLCNEKNFVRWATPFLKEESKLVQILDPRIKSKCSLKGAVKIAEVAMQCLKKKEAQRPSMSRVVDALKSIKKDFSGRVQQQQQQQQSSKTLEQRRATLRGTSFRDLEERSNLLDRRFSSMNGRSSGSVLGHFCACASHFGKVAQENAKANSYRVLTGF